MKIPRQPKRSVRIEMLPLIDIVFLLLVFFIYAMLSMAVHRGMPVLLPSSSEAAPDSRQHIAVSVDADGNVFVDRRPVPLRQLSRYLQTRMPTGAPDAVMLFADHRLDYQSLFRVLDEIRTAGVQRISLQAQSDSIP